MTLCRLIDGGDPSIRLPAYDGGLFSSDAAPILEQVRLPDSAVAPLLYGLSHAGTPEEPRFVNYRDMSVQQLGSIYERLLEREPVLEDGAIEVRLNPYARKDSGSFYTPQELVDLVIEKTLGPLVDERRDAFLARAAELKSDRRPKDQRLADLAKLDPAEAVLDLKVLDPAMGSGHFLVSAVDFLADHVIRPDRGPARGRVARRRLRLAAGRAHRNGPQEHQEQPRLGARERRADPDHRPGSHPPHGPQAMHLRRRQEPHDRRACQGLPLAPQLHRRRALSFLDHHLRCGDSLVGMWINEAAGELDRLGGLFASSAIAGAEGAVQQMLRIEAMSDSDVAEVHESADHLLPRRERDRRPPRPPRLPVRTPLADRGNEQDAARRLRTAHCRCPRTQRRGLLRPPRAWPGSRRFGDIRGAGRPLRRDMASR